ncbi:nitrate- and nitrite sensing domain-containing protein [Sphaerimonospora sp. CA-214678]|uniref:nitrate- and nitrite sensing domain-containing protein n=1 Tax=Sphaerimonospora sp. CA-214678 TaxID=3240029 RepID=UPI003D89F3D6
MSMEQPKTDKQGWRRRLVLRNWRVPTRLAALILAPTLVAVLVSGLRVAQSIDDLGGYRLARSAAEYSVHLRDLAEQLALERDMDVWGGPARRKFNVDGETELTRAQQRAVVDPLVTQVKADLREIVDADFGARATDQAQQVGSRLLSLPGIRENGAPEDYSALIANLLRLQDEISSTDAVVATGNVRALNALAHAKEEVALQRSMLIDEFQERRQSFTAAELEAMLASQAREQGYLATFYKEAPPAESSRLVTLLGDKDIVSIELTKSWALTLGLKGQSMSGYPGRDRMLQSWFQNSTKAIAQMTAVEKTVSSTVLDRAKQLQSSEQRNVVTSAILILALLVLVVVTTALIARSMVRPLRRLRAEALDVAGRRLPDVVRRMRETDEHDHEPAVRPIDVDGDDEIGEVARAFDEVHTQALRLAAEESRLRANVNAMFVNLSRRTQTLVERQISLIDGLERGEEDGRRLADLFKLDHLATRMRRNSENLLVLAGHEPPRKRSRPARLVDVVRASLSEVEDYERVTVKVPRRIAIAGHAANDVIHLVAELVENAIAFSPRDTRVVVSSSPVEGGAVMLGVSDAGIGMSLEEIGEINRRLAEPPTVDVSVARRMGLFVVGRLALRHGIRVQLRRGDGNGVIAMVLFPAQLISDADQPQPPVTAPGGQTAGGQTLGGQIGAGQIGANQIGAGQGAGGRMGGGPARGDQRTSAGLPVRQPFGDPAPGGNAFQPWEATGGGSGGNHATGGGLGGNHATGGGLGGNHAAGGGLGGADTGRRPFQTADAAAGGDGGTFAPFGAPTRDITTTPPFGTPFTPPQAEPYATPPEPFPVPPPEPYAGGHADSFGAPPYRGTPAFTEHSGVFPIEGPASATGPLPAVGDTPLERGDEFLPIFASVESAWFRRPEPGEAAPATSANPPVPRREPPPASAAQRPQAIPPTSGPAGSEHERPAGGWWSRADSGFQAADSARDPQLGGVTAAGLPKRTPRANLVPGSVGTASTPPAPRPAVSAEAVRSRLSSFQQGVRRGRAEVADGFAGETGNEEEGS